MTDVQGRVVFTYPVIAAGADTILATYQGAFSAPSTAVPLFPGWNLIGSPYHSDVPWARVTVRGNGSPPVSLDQAVTNGWIRSPLYSWSGSAYTTLAASGTFQPLKGYWLKAVSSGLTIIFSH